MTSNFLKGFAIGMIVPVIGLYFYVTLVLQSGFETGLKQLWHENLFSQVLALSILTNLLPLFVYNSRKENQKLNGVTGASLLYALTVSIMYFI